MGDPIGYLAFLLNIGVESHFAFSFFLSFFELGLAWRPCSQRSSFKLAMIYLFMLNPLPSLICRTTSE